MRRIGSPSLAARTTLGMGGTCAAEIVLEERGELDLLPGILEREGLPAFVVGQGSNILGHDGHRDVVLVRPKFSEGPRVAGETGGLVHVEAGAGVPLPVLLAFCRERGLSGLEGLSGIPGSVGGAVAMNAGSFGACMGDRLVSADVWAGGAVRAIPASACGLGYRTFVPPIAGPGPFVVAGATLALLPSRREEVAARMAATLAQKRARQPVGERSAGCVFRNPPSGPSAGILLDRAGFRGRRLGGAAFSEVHANFLVNRDGGTAAEALELIRLARLAVADMFSVRLELEVREI